ncbi:putative integral membrane protein [Frankia canadensis]|uniref:Putative integral membrane protein n=1 Tax=Frankia canadensis TaxID=1836972 RepID=A0A2I2KLU7_9ACTN|nr:hypothetical protein [Frankia canadensis]SNQ46632.1 putative integral membrane protein [Frankia canadensis]SOU53922.1 putative integral membrane protein [Frankia canadensis]
MPHPGAFGLLLTLHIVLAILVVGPLTLTCAAVPSLLRAGAGSLPALRVATRLVRGFAAASLLITLTGVAMVHEGSFGSVRSLGDTWLAASLVLWAVGCAACLGVVAPGLSRAATDIGAGGDGRGRLVPIAGGALVSTGCWLVIVALMVVKPGG